MSAPADIPDESLLDLVGAFLTRFGRSIRLGYRLPSGEGCVIVFPDPEPTKPVPDAREPS